MRRWVGLLLVAAGLAVGIVAGSWLLRPARGKYAQSERYVWTVRIQQHVPFPSGRFTLDSLAKGSRGHIGFPGFGWRVTDPFSKIAPRLAGFIRVHPADTSSVEAVVLFRDRNPSQRLPLESIWTAPDSTTRANRIATVDSLRNVQRKARAMWYPLQTRALRVSFHAIVRDSLVLAQAVVASIRLDRILALARSEEVQSIRLLKIEHALPNCPEPGTDVASVADAASAMGLGSLKTAGLMHGGLKLLDSGVDGSHAWFQGLPTTDVPLGAGPALVLKDCVHSPGCSGSTLGDCGECGHGTSTAAILIARGSAAAEDQGVTDAVVHSARVYPCAANGDTASDVLAVEAALLGSSATPANITAVEIADYESPDGTLENLADNAFREGAALVAAIGNTGGGSLGWQSQAPGDARGALGIGARLGPGFNADYGQESHGGVEDRQKPDIQAPTKTRTASNGGGTRAFEATSGATPYAAAAALGLRNLLSQATPVVDPGQVYSAIIACGTETRSVAGEFPPLRGAGLDHLPSEGQCWFGAMELGAGAVVRIPLEVAGPAFQQLRIGAWWMDAYPAHGLCGLVLKMHRDFDISLFDPNGSLVASSSGPFGVFERIAFPPAGAIHYMPGTWQLEIRAKRVALWNATIYWTAFATPTP